jgi:UDP-N-acetylglucosamine:LPS N-acetylglucosamine transferase
LNGKRAAFISDFRRPSRTLNALATVVISKAGTADVVSVMVLGRPIVMVM